MSTPAHTVTEHLTLAYAFPAHEPRAHTPAYRYFNAARARMEKLGLLTCWICGATQGIELHHNACEFALANAVDWEKFAADHLDWHISSDDDFQRMIEGEGALLALCVLHHRGMTGIHSIHYPAWITQRWLKDATFIPEQVVHNAKP